MKRHALRAGEALAIAPDAIKRDGDGFYLLSGPPPPDNETHGTVQVVHIRGALVHYKTEDGDSYEAILERITAALDKQPTSVVLRLDSPGGVVAGLNETVRCIQQLSKAKGVRFIAYVDEMAASAAYALACSCEEILAPKSAVVGSVGVISTMMSVARQDAAHGVDFQVITSGARKADGHIHVPISDAAVAAETKRNGELAKQFFALAGKARGMAPRKLEALQANIFLGADALAVGLIDDVMSYSDVVFALDAKPAGIDPGHGNETDRRAKSKLGLDNTAEAGQRSVAQLGTLQSATPPKGDPMSVKLEALIKKAEAAASVETDPNKLAAIRVDLAMMQAVHAKMIGGEEDDGEGDDDSDDSDSSSDEEDESKAKKAAAKAEEAKRKAEAAKHRAKAAEHKKKAAEYEEKAKKAEEEDEESEEEESEEESEESEASAGLTPALAAIANNARELSSLKNKLAKSDQEKAIASALASGHITPEEARVAAAQSPARATQFLGMLRDARKGGRVVNVDDGHLIVPSGSPNADMPSAALAEIDERIRMMGIKDPAQVEKLRGDMIANRRKLAANGAVERY